jgi:aryl-alcohol dehydrogenase-like predicted oxidoreductase
VRTVTLGAAGPVVGAIGFGAWGLSGAYGAADESGSIRTIRRALDLGLTLIDTADEYGDGHNERLVGRALRGRRDEAVLTTKAGLVALPDGSTGVRGRPEHLRAALERSLARLGVEAVDLFLLHRLDPDVPVEESVGAMAELVRAGKARALGLSEAGPDAIRRAHAVHPLAAVQSEYSLWTREPERDVLPAVRELGIGFVAFSPLGRGFLAGAVASPAELDEDDFRRQLPRFQEAAFRANLALLEDLRELAGGLGVTPAELALAWLVRKGAVPIPGTRRLSHLEQNARAAALELTEAELARLERAFASGRVAGDRYPAALAALTGGGT